MAGKFEIKAGKTGKFRFNLKASNGQVILTSEAYDTRKAAEGGIASVKKNAGDDQAFRTQDRKGRLGIFRSEGSQRRTDRKK